MLHSDRCEANAILPSGLDTISATIPVYTMGNTYNSRSNADNDSPIDTYALKHPPQEKSPSSSRKRGMVNPAAAAVEPRHLSKRSLLADKPIQERAAGRRGHESVTVIATSSKSVLQPVDNRTIAIKSPTTLTLSVRDSHISSQLPRLPDTSTKNVNPSVISQEEVHSLKELVSMHLTLARQQQEIIMEKDKLIAELRAEALTLKTRLERMDRRLTIVKTTNHQTGKSADSACNKAEAVTPLKNHSVQTKNSHKDDSSISDEAMTRLTPQSRRQDCRHKTRVAKTAKPIGTAQNSSADGLLRLERDYFTQQVVPFQELAEETIPNKEDTHLIEVPSFRIVHYSDLATHDFEEETDDKSYLKRHQRHETEERRRKRWDLQRLREVQKIEKLKLNKSHRNSLLVQKPDSQVEHIYPKAEDAQYIEVCERLPLSVFGQAVASLPESEFSLPWCKAAKSSASTKRQKTNTIHSSKKRRSKR